MYLILFILCSCNQGGKNDIDRINSQLSSIKESIAKNAQDISVINNNMNSIGKLIGENKNELFIHEFVYHQMKKYSHISIDTSNFTLVETNLAPLLVSVKRINNYMNGYSVLLSIGNISTCDFKGFDLTAIWNKPYDNIQNIVEYKKSEKSYKNTYANDLRGGSWTEIIVNLSPMTVDEANNISINIELNRVSLIKSNM
jgi:hypothetical protein